MSEVLQINENDAEALGAETGYFRERWNILKRNRLAYASYWFLIILFVSGELIIGLL